MEIEIFLPFPNDQSWHISIVIYTLGNEATTVVAPAIATAQAVFATTQAAPATTEAAGMPARGRQADVEATTDSSACTCPRTIAKVLQNHF